MLKSEKELVKSFKTFLSNCDILKKLPNSVEKYSNRIKKVPKGFWIDEIVFLPKSYKTYGKWMKKKGFRKLEKSYQKRGFSPGVRLG